MRSSATPESLPASLSQAASSSAFALKLLMGGTSQAGSQSMICGIQHQMDAEPCKPAQLNSTWMAENLLKGANNNNNNNNKCPDGTSPVINYHGCSSTKSSIINSTVYGKKMVTNFSIDAIMNDSSDYRPKSEMKEIIIQQDSSFSSPKQVPEVNKVDIKLEQRDSEFNETTSMIKPTMMASKKLTGGHHHHKRIRQKNFHCFYCKTSFSNNGQLRNHVRIHTGERPFKCNRPECQKSFTRNEELTRHKRIHTGLKPYACPKCEQRFGRKDHLQKHIKIHEKSSNRSSSSRASSTGSSPAKNFPSSNLSQHDFNQAVQRQNLHQTQALQSQSTPIINSTCAPQHPVLTTATTTTPIITPNTTTISGPITALNDFMSSTLKAGIDRLDPMENLADMVAKPTQSCGKMMPHQLPILNDPQTGNPIKGIDITSYQYYLYYYYYRYLNY